MFIKHRDAFITVVFRKEVIICFCSIAQIYLNYEPLNWDMILLPHLFILFLKVSLILILIKDLPSLTRISLGKYSLRGTDNWSCGLSMKSILYLFTHNILDLTNLMTLESENYSFDYTRKVTIHCRIGY